MTVVYKEGCGHVGEILTGELSPLFTDIPVSITNIQRKFATLTIKI